MASVKVLSEVAGKVWKIELQVGAQAPADEPIMIIESMKMEIPVQCEKAGRLIELLVAEGDPVAEGQVVAILEV
jgi:acetyl-CoA carboxylase biotin carboxyl carrier protein